jgi:hypothetical protein
MQPGDRLNEGGDFSDYFLSEMNDSYNAAHTNQGSSQSSKLWGFEKPRFNSQKWDEIISFATTSRSVLSIQLSIQWVPGVLFLVKQVHRQANHSPPSTRHTCLQSVVPGHRHNVFITANERNPFSYRNPFISWWRFNSTRILCHGD